MSTLKTQIKNDMKEAMRAKDNIKRDTLRSINTMIKQIEVDQRIELKDPDIIKIIQKAIKQRKEAATQYETAQRPELVEIELNEAKIIESYLPKQLNDDELKEIIQNIITKTGATSIKEMGKVMGIATKETTGKADGGRVSSIVKDLLN